MRQSFLAGRRMLRRFANGHLRSWLGIALVVALMGAGVIAEETSGFYTSNEDLYYHLLESCGGVAGRVPISQLAAEAFGKFACPVCSPGSSAEAPRAAVRGGTVVVAVSDGYLAGQELAGVFNWNQSEPVSQADAQEMLAEYLNGDEYLQFMNSYAEKGVAQGVARLPELMSGGVLLSRRHLQGAWYLAVRPDVSLNQVWTVDLRICGFSLHMEQDALYQSFDFQTTPEAIRLQLERAQENTIYEASQGALSVSVYRELDTNIAVFYDRTQNDLEGTGALRIGERVPCVELEGYQDADAWVYCCVLTDAELAALERGETMAIVKGSQSLQMGN